MAELQPPGKVDNFLSRWLLFLFFVHSERVGQGGSDFMTFEHAAALAAHTTQAQLIFNPSHTIF